MLPVALREPNSVKLHYDLPFQKKYSSRGPHPLPLVIHNLTLKTIESVAKWLTLNSNEIDSLLLLHGAILFRSFPLEKAEDFRDFVTSFPAWQDLPYEESLSYGVRIPVCSRVCTANEGKHGGMIFHHEQAQTPKYPSKLLFFCERPATVGGGTGVCPSDVVLERLEEKYPDFVRNCEVKGVKYWTNLNKIINASTRIGRGWSSLFACDTKEEVEQKMKQYGYTWEWLEKKGAAEPILRTCSPLLLAVLKSPGSNRRVFFNQLIGHWIRNVRDYEDGKLCTNTEITGGINIADFLMFGDGSQMEAEPLEYAYKLCEDTAVDVMWEKGDVILLDNYQVMHARRDFEGPRRLLTSLVE